MKKAIKILTIINIVFAVLNILSIGNIESSIMTYLEYAKLSVNELYEMGIDIDSFVSIITFINILSAILCIGFGSFVLYQLSKNKKNIAIGVISIFCISLLVGILYLIWKPETEMMGSSNDNENCSVGTKMVSAKLKQIYENGFMTSDIYYSRIHILLSPNSYSKEREVANKIDYLYSEFCNGKITNDEYLSEKDKALNEIM